MKKYCIKKLSLNINNDNKQKHFLKKFKNLNSVHILKNIKNIYNSLYSLNLQLFDMISVYTMDSNFLVLYRSDNPKNFFLFDIYNYKKDIPFKDVNKNILYNLITKRQKSYNGHLYNKCSYELELSDFTEDRIICVYWNGESIKKHDNKKKTLINRLIDHVVGNISYNEPIILNDDVFNDIKQYCPNYIDDYNLISNKYELRKNKINKIKKKLI